MIRPLICCLDGLWSSESSATLEALRPRERRGLLLLSLWLRDWAESSRGDPWKHLQLEYKGRKGWTMNPFLASLAHLSNALWVTHRSIHMAFDLRVLLAVTHPCGALKFALHLLSGLKLRRLESGVLFGLTAFITHRSADFYLHLQLTSPLQNVFTRFFFVPAALVWAVSLGWILNWSTKGSNDLESNVKSKAPVAATINPSALMNVPRDRGDASVSSPQAAPLS